MSLDTAQTSDPRTPQRLRHETRLRLLTVSSVTEITPLMRRIRLTGDMEGFVSPGHADHIKAFFFPAGVEPLLPPMGPNGAEFAPGTRPEMRDYTPRYWNTAEGWIELDFVLHGDGPASGWAAKAAPGHTLVIGGPRGSMVVPTTYDWYLLVGDETALPAIGRRLEELPEGAPVVAVIEVASPQEEQTFNTKADLDLIYVHRNGAAPGSTTLLLDTVKSLTLPKGDAYAYVAGESEMSKALKTHLIDERNFNTEWLKTAGYWLRGTSDAHEPH